ncbi:hypothetical protein Pla175_01990 [Pirellulimonas nuda]|uniref:site-specific DNA-methyltransferase (adenine-specific) n=1 Tax=Pirellulimonas nuda TaxID=2528009 RepID=A0A518D5U3_9BACT|nr:DNA methyltransferase [Pirellulimonas nuda]QDU86846.1 hypothetical protein Pla175_01990 [Pirellulimonas nuda]
MQADAFIERWAPSGGSERANYQSFLNELCDLLGVPHPDPAKAENQQNAYVFERAVTFDNRDGTQSTGFVDLYKRGAFVCETKQGVEAGQQGQLLSERQQKAQAKRKSGHGLRGTSAYENAMQRAVGQAERYARSLPPDEGRPPFLLVVDVGHSLRLYSEFSQTGGAYVPFPDPRSHTIKLADLEQEEVRERLRLVWTDPLALDPARQSAKVTRAIADKLAKLAKSLEAAGHDPQDVAHFLMRCLFTMFAEDVELLPKHAFRDLLRGLESPKHFRPVVEELWRTMDRGGFSTLLRKDLLYFNGGLFHAPTAIDVTRDELDLLIEGAEQDWRDVEPAIFGTLLERALDPVERHKLGAHYTPRAYVERLVVPTVVEPLRDEWAAARAAAMTLEAEGDTAGAVAELRRYHDRLCEVRVLDPACGSGNFLYVTLEHLKRIEGEVIAALEALGQTQTMLEGGHTVDPHQLLGIEINPRAAAIAELVLWIGYLQWHFRTRGKVDPPQPVIQNFKNIECRDAVLDWSSREIVLDDAGKPVTIWDGRTTKPHPVTGLEVPDESARLPMYRYLNPKKAEWPEADFVVGNPPFIGASKMRHDLGDGYVDAIRSTYDELPESCDYVMYWWHKAAVSLRNHESVRFGFITTNSIRQTFNRRVLQLHLETDAKCELAFVIPDHPWVDSTDGAAVRIGMTVAGKPAGKGILVRVVSESSRADGSSAIELEQTEGFISAALRIGARIDQTAPLKANHSISNTGVKLHGSGFLVTREKASELGLGSVSELEWRIREYRHGRDLSQVSRNLLVIDLHELSQEAVRDRFPAVYQHVVDNVKPERDQNNEKYRRENWWLFGRKNTELRNSLRGLERFIATPETAKHRYFVFLDGRILPDNMLINVGLDDAYALGVLSSRPHTTWSLASGGRMGVGNDPRYNKTRCFETFPFPEAIDAQKSRIRELGEQLDAHRKRQQAAHPSLTMTGMYNVLEKLRSGETLNPKERTIHEQGLVAVLKQNHDDLDAAVAEAYGWPVDLSDEEILERLVALNHERAEEERRGLVRWLRPEFQNPSGESQQGMAVGEDAAAPKRGSAAAGAAKLKKLAWPKTLSEQAAAVGQALGTLSGPATAADVSKRFTRANKERVAELLETLAALGRARRLEDGRYAA